MEGREDKVTNRILGQTPGRSKRKRLIVVVLINVFLIIAITVVYYFVIDWSYEPEDLVPCGNGMQLFCVESTSSTSAILYFSKLPGDPDSTKLKIVLENDSTWGNYTFPSNASGTYLVLESGNDMANITYRDLADNGILNYGDRLIMSGLSPNTAYDVDLIWIPSGDRIHDSWFRTPPG
jgi:hypothetical protein